MEIELVAIRHDNPVISITNICHDVLFDILRLCSVRSTLNFGSTCTYTHNMIMVAEYWRGRIPCTYVHADLLKSIQMCEDTFHGIIGGLFSTREHVATACLRVITPDILSVIHVTPHIRRNPSSSIIRNIMQAMQCSICNYVGYIASIQLGARVYHISSNQCKCRKSIMSLIKGRVLTYLDVIICIIILLNKHDKHESAYLTGFLTDIELLFTCGLIL